MSESQSSPVSTISLDDMTLSAPAVAVLEFTSDIRGEKSFSELNYITSKDAYIWAGIAVLIAEVDNLAKTESVDDIEINSQLYQAVSEMGRIRYGLPSFETFLPGMITQPPRPPLSIVYPISDQTCYSNRIILSLLEKFVLPYYPYQKITNDVNNYVFSGYHELLNAHLITDPVIETTLALAILSFVPFSIVKRTRKGNVVYRKVQAALWKYETERRSGGISQTHVTFEAARIAKAVKTGLVAAYHEATKGAGDEPEE